MASGVTLTKGYLVCYNALQAVGWVLVCVSLTRGVISTSKITEAHKSSGQDVCILVFAAVLEVLHALFGLVPSKAPLALMQWAGRAHVQFAIIMNVPEVQNTVAVFVIYICWALSEVIRYPQYALSLLGICPGFLTWLRYSAFIVLYPLAVFYGEMHVMYLALPHVKSSKLYGKFLSFFGIDYNMFLVGLLVVYPFLWIQLYLHMLKQRQAKLGRGGSKKTSKRKKAE